MENSWLSRFRGLPADERPGELHVERPEHEPVPAENGHLPWNDNAVGETMRSMIGDSNSPGPIRRGGAILELLSLLFGR